jgi:hypothetical protein
VNKYDAKWKKQWYGAGLFFEGSEQINVDVFKKLEKRKVLLLGLIGEGTGIAAKVLKSMGINLKDARVEALSAAHRLTDTTNNVFFSGDSSRHQPASSHSISTSNQFSRLPYFPLTPLVLSPRKPLSTPSMARTRRSELLR